MGKKILVGIGIFLLILIIAGVYLYEFHVFKTLRVCVNDEEIEDTFIECMNVQDCRDTVNSIKEINELKTSPDIPVFLRAKFEEILDKVLFCEDSCKMRHTYSNVFFDDAEEIDNCQPGEDEVVLDIRGKEALELLNFMRKNPEMFK